MIWLSTVALAAPCFYLKSDAPAQLERPAPCVVGEAPQPLIAELHRVRRAFSELFFTIGISDLSFTEAGYVALPIVHFLTEAERADEYKRENLRTQAQQEKATSAIGPSADGQPIYSHFLGADTRHTDLWAEPSALIDLLHLAASWHQRCLSREQPVAHASARTCSLQIGDLAYFTPVQPDPLGHFEHYTGRCVDLRLFRQDGSRYEAYWNRPDDRDAARPGYSRALTGAFIAHALNSGRVHTLFFNDPQLQRPGVQAKPRHDDHLHLCF